MEDASLVGPDPSLPGEQQLEALLDVVRRNVSRRGRRRAVLRAVGRGHLARAPRPRLLRRALPPGRGRAHRGVRRLRAPRPGSAARRLVAVMDGLQVQWLLHPDDVDMVAEVRAQVERELGRPRGESAHVRHPVALPSMSHHRTTRSELGS